MKRIILVVVGLLTVSASANAQTVAETIDRVLAAAPTRARPSLPKVLRREGLYSSHLTTWRKAAHSGSLKALSKKRGRKPERNPLDEKVRKLERRNARLENELRKAHLIIDVQGKVAGLLGISLDDGTNS